MDAIPKFNTFFTIVVGYLKFNTVGTAKLPQDSKKRERLKILLWVLATALNLMFAYRVWTIVLPGMILGWLVWGMTGAASLVTFYFLFLYGDKKTCRSGK